MDLNGNPKELEQSKNFLKKNKLGGLTPFEFKTYYKTQYTENYDTDESQMLN